MNYEKMWKDLKAKIEKDLQFYEDGTMCSMMEAAHGSMHCEAMLKEMEAIEKVKNEHFDFIPLSKLSIFQISIIPL